MEAEDIVFIETDQSYSSSDESKEEHVYYSESNPVYYSSESSSASEELEGTSSYITDYDSDYWDHDEYVFVEYEEQVSPEEEREPEIYVHYHPDIVPKGWWYDPKYVPKSSPEEAIIHIPSYHDSDGFLSKIGGKFGKLGGGIGKFGKKITGGTKKITSGIRRRAGSIGSGIRRKTKKLTGGISKKVGSLKKKIRIPFKGKGGTTKKPMAKMGTGTKPATKKKKPSAPSGESVEERTARKREQAKQRKIEARRMAAKEKKLEEQRTAKEERRMQLQRREAEKRKAAKIRRDIEVERKVKKQTGIKGKIGRVVETVTNPQALQLRTIAGQMGFDNTGLKFPTDVNFIKDFTKYTSGLDVKKASSILEMAKNNGWTRNDILNQYNTLMKSEGGMKGAAKRSILKLAIAFKKGPFDLPDISNL